MKHVVVNINGKIWAFIDELMEYTIERNEEQVLTIKVQNQGLDIEVSISLVYAK